MTASTRAHNPSREPDRLTRHQLDALRRLLEDERTALLERATIFVDENGQIDPTSATHGQGETEHTAVDIERRVNDLLEASTHEALAEIETALRRIDGGTYGSCLECGAAIPGERLVAMPAARYCVRCQSAHEQRRP
jgi:RNA polymerase-binding transcription factor DksA